MIEIGGLAFAIMLAGLGIASYTDIKIREVPNSLSFGLIFAMIIVRVVYAFQTNNFGSLWLSLLIGAGFFSLGLLFFYTQQWGGADIKILTALGIGFATIFPEFNPLFPVSWPFFLTILMNFFLLAVVYAISYAILMSFSNKNVIPDFKAALSKHELLGSAAIFVAVLVATYYRTIYLAFIAIPILWFLYKFLKSVEQNCMFKTVNVDRLVEFDVPEKDITYKGKVVVSSKDPNGMTLKQVEKLKKMVANKQLKNSFKIKWGIPLIPVFPITLVVSLYVGDIYFALIRAILMR